MSICKHGVDSNEASCANCQNERHRKAGLKTRKAIAGISKFLAPIFGHWVDGGCICCGIHGAVTPQHIVWYNEGSGSSVLCEGCWHDLPTSEKVRYYRLAYEKYWSDGDRKWEDIEMAVRHPYPLSCRQRSPMSICKTCIHWKMPEKNDDYNGTMMCTPYDQDTYEPMKRGFEVRICKHPSQTFAESPTEDNGFGLVDASRYFACLATAENFGCVRHEGA